MPETRNRLPEKAIQVARDFKSKFERRYRKSFTPSGEPTDDATRLALARHKLVAFNQRIPTIAEDGSIIHRNPDQQMKGSGGTEPKLMGTILPENAEHAKKVREELSTSELMADPKTGQKLGVVRANWEKFNSEMPVTMFFALYGNVTTEKDSQRTKLDETILRLEQLGIQIPEYPLISIDYPSVGASDSLRPEQKSTSPNDSYYAIADTQLRILQKLGVKKLNLIGQSMGAYAAITVAAQAAEYGISVGIVELYDSPGVMKLPVAELMRRDLSELSGGLDQYSTFPYDPEMYYASGVARTKSLLTIARENVKNLFQTLKKDPGFVYARSMAEETIEQRAAKTLETQSGLKEGDTNAIPTKIAFINGSESTVSPGEKVKTIAQRLRSRFGNESVTRSIYPGEGHLVMINAKRFAADARLRIVQHELGNFIKNAA